MSTATTSVDDLKSLEAQALSELNGAPDEATLRTWNTRYFGKTGEMVTALKRVGEVAPDQRKTYGQEANRIKESLTAAYEKALADRQEADLARSLTEDKLDVTLPGRSPSSGRLHLATQT